MSKIRHKFRNILIAAKISINNPRLPRYECPICGYRGPFLTIQPQSGRRLHAQCPGCKALERHRLQFLVLNSLFSSIQCNSMKMIHFAPEIFFKTYFTNNFASYETADLFMENVDHKVDMTALPFPPESFDFVFASHVLEHIRNDLAALAEICRILRPNGFAVLPVPLVSKTTIEYSTPNPDESYHVRAPGYDDYFDRYKLYFNRVEIYTSEHFQEKYQLYIYGERAVTPAIVHQLPTSLQGDRHLDMVPVCFR